MSRCLRLHFHFYECCRNGHVLGGATVRSGSTASAAVSAHQCIEAGMFCYRSSNNAISTEGFGGVIGPRYFRFVLRLHHDPQRNRSILWEQSQAAGSVREPVADTQPETMFTQTNPEAYDTMYEATPPQSNSEEEASSEWPDHPLDTSDLCALEGIRPFSYASSDYAPGRITDDQIMLSLMTRTAKEAAKEANSLRTPAFGSR